MKKILITIIAIMIIAMLPGLISMAMTLKFADNLTNYMSQQNEFNKSQNELDKAIIEKIMSQNK